MRLISVEEQDCGGGGGGCGEWRSSGPAIKDSVYKPKPNHQNRQGEGAGV